MPHFIALELSGNEVRIAVASGRSDRVVVERAISIPLPASPPADTGESTGVATVPAQWGAAIAAALDAEGITRCETLVSVGRANVELRHMVLPPSPDDELPELVRFQAIRDFHQLDDDWLLDYIPLEAKANEPRAVLAAALGPELSAQLRQTCEAAGLPLRRLGLRPCAVASLYGCSLGAPSEGVCLLVDLFSDDVDLTALVDGQVVFARTARLPGDPLQSADHRGALSGEIRRTVAAVQNQLDGRSIAEFVLVGDPREHAALADSLRSQFNVLVSSFDPFAMVKRGAALATKLPERSGRFAALLGMLVTELEQRRHPIDFVNPRRRPAPPSRRNHYIAAAAAVALLLFGYLLYGRMERVWLEAEIDSLDAQLKTVTPEAEKAAKLETKVKEIEKWTDDEVVWLDQLQRMSKAFPPAKEAMVGKLSFGPGTRLGEIKFEGLAQSKAIAEVTKRTRSPEHTFVDRGSHEDKSRSPYDRSYAASVLIGPAPKTPPPPATAPTPEDAGKPNEPPRKDQ